MSGEQEIAQELESWKSETRSNKKTDYTKTEYLKLSDAEDVDIRILTKPKSLWMHRIAAGKTRYPATCLGLSECPACKSENKATKTNSAAVLDRRDGKVKLWEFSDYLKQDVYVMMKRWNKTAREFDIVVSRRGLKKETRYNVTMSPNQNLLTEEEQKLELPNLEEYYKPNRERMETLLKGEVPQRKEKTETEQPTGASSTDDNNTFVESSSFPNKNPLSDEDII